MLLIMFLRFKINKTRQNSRAQNTIIKLQNNLNNIKIKMKNITDTNLNILLENSNIPANQAELIKEMFDAAKYKNPKNRKYNENWMLSCLLFQIR